MAKNDFDIDFDFEKEYGFDPKAVLDSDYSDDDLDLSQFDDEALGLDADTDGDFDDFDLDNLDDLDLDGPTGAESEPVQAAAPGRSSDPDDFDDLGDRNDLGGPDAEGDLDDMDDLDDLDFEDEDLEEETQAEDVSRRASFFGMDTDLLRRKPEAKAAEKETPSYAPPAAYEVPSQDEGNRNPEPSYEEPDDNPEQEPDDAQRPAARQRRERTKKEKQPGKAGVPNFFTRLVRLYFPTQQEIRERMETPEGRRRRKPSKQQIFKEFYLPPLILGLSLVLILSFVIGSLSNTIDAMQQKRKEEDDKAKQESIAAEQLATEGTRVLQEAERLAQGYDYDGAIAALDTYQGTESQEMIAKRSEYMNAKALLVEHQDPTLIPNLSFHVLVQDMSRALKDTTGLAGSYNRNFVSTAEFSRVLEQLYANNFVLVNFESFVGSASLDGTTEKYDKFSIWLPEGKKPVMITETMVNYYTYMIDSNNDGLADSGGSGFASRLVVDDNGDVKAEYVDENNVTSVGNYDLVPILEDFIAQHPDFSYKGARATLAVSGSEGIFGYRIQSESRSKKGDDYYNEQIAGATKVVDRLRALGYRLACYTFDNTNYAKISADMVNQDIQKWKTQIAPVIGEVDTIVFARASDIGDYTGGKFEVLRAAGFRYMLKSGDAPYTEVNNTYVRQTRLMVTGENMVAKPSMFTSTGVFDPNAILDLSIRGNVPTG